MSQVKERGVEDKVEKLEGIRLFQDVPRADLEEIASRLKSRHFEEGEVVCRQGDPGASLLIVASGEVTIRIHGDGEKEIVVAVLRPGAAFGELSLIDGEPRSASGIATADTELWVLDRSTFLNLVETNPAISHGLNMALTAMVRATNEKLADVTFLDVHARMAKALLELGQRYGKTSAEGIRLTGHGDPDEIAQLTGLHRAEVERLIETYQYEDILRGAAGDLIISRPRALESWLRMARK